MRRDFFLTVRFHVFRRFLEPSIPFPKRITTKNGWSTNNSSEWAKNSTFVLAQPVSLRRARESDVPSISQGMIFSFPRFGWGKEVFGSLWIPLWDFWKCLSIRLWPLRLRISGRLSRLSSCSTHWDFEVLVFQRYRIPSSGGRLKTKSLQVLQMNSGKGWVPGGTGLCSFSTLYEQYCSGYPETL